MGPRSIAGSLGAHRSQGAPAGRDDGAFLTTHPPAGPYGEGDARNPGPWDPRILEGGIARTERSRFFAFVRSGVQEGEP